MKVKDLLSVLPEYQKLPVSDSIADWDQIEVANLTADSRIVQARSVFVAIRGHKQDGHTFLSQVIEKNPAVLIVEQKKDVSHFKGLVLQVENSRESLDLLASRYYGDPSQSLYCFGVTGTNGKTSCTYMMEHILNSVGFPTGVIGTINHHFKNQVWPTAVTTPGALDLQSRLQEMRNAGAKAIAMEVSSHALDQHRVSSVHFNTVLFTNLTLDHLDYHGSMEKYFQAKQKLFTDLLWSSAKHPQFAIINIDDRYGKKMRVASRSGLWTYGVHSKADYKFNVTQSDFARTEFELRTPFGSFKSFIPMCGLHNVYNAVGCVASAASLGIPALYSLRALENFPGVPGRLQSVPNSKNITVLIDYAHTPDALENVLKALSQIKKNKGIQSKIICVFGCGGDRDKSKRPIMAATSELYCDEVIITSDNPRTEDPFQIIQEINQGFAKLRPIIEVDRRAAIGKAVQSASANDVVLIAGKGHEDYQIIGQEKFPFDDYQISQEFLR